MKKYFPTERFKSFAITCIDAVLQVGKYIEKIYIQIYPQKASNRAVQRRGEERNTKLFSPYDHRKLKLHYGRETPLKLRCAVF